MYFELIMKIRGIWQKLQKMGIGSRRVTHPRHRLSPFNLFSGFQFFIYLFFCLDTILVYIIHILYCVLPSRVLLFPHSLSPGRHTHSLTSLLIHLVHYIFLSPYLPPHTLSHTPHTDHPSWRTNLSPKLPSITSSHLCLSSACHIFLPLPVTLRYRGACFLTQSILLATRVLGGIRVGQRDCFTQHPFLQSRNKHAPYILHCLTRRKCTYSSPSTMTFRIH